MIIKNNNLLLVAFASVFFSRVIHALGFPAIINFAHLVLVPTICWLVLSTNRSQKHVYSSIISPILIGLYFLLLMMLISTLINQVGVINIILEFILLAEPFMFVLAIVSFPIASESIKNYRTWTYRFGIAMILFAYMQRFVFHLEKTGNDYDNIKGVFIAEGAGHYVGAAVSLTFGVYYFTSIATDRSKWVRITTLIIAVGEVIIAGRRQTFFAFLVALIILAIFDAKSIKKLLIYFAIMIVSFTLLFIAAFTIFTSLRTWFRSDIIQPFIDLKFSPFQIIPAHYKSYLNILFGVGPGHSVDRLGGWMLRDDGYWDLLRPLGATRSTISNEVWNVTAHNWLGDQSTFFSPFFSWAGIWGDLGFVGLGAYIFLGFLLWKLVCLDRISKFFLLTVLVFGFIFTWLEEPAYMNLMGILLGLRWHEIKEKKYVKPLGDRSSQSVT